MSQLQVIVDRGGVWFAGSAARPAGEPQAVLRLPRIGLDPRPQLRATRIEIPQVADRHAVCLAKPAWTWGAMLGANEYGVAIGTTVAPARGRALEGGLTAVDLVRLGLERGATAREALHVIANLVEQHGQGDLPGDRGPQAAGLLLADAEEAWVLEAAGRRWAARGVRQYWSLSNALTLRGDYDLACPALQERRVDFAARFGARLRPRLSGASGRRKALLRRLQDAADKAMDPPAAFELVRDAPHAPASTGHRAVCAHATGSGRDRQATNPLVARLTTDGMRLWCTGTAAPCLSLFRPVRVDDEADWSVLTPLYREPYAPLWHAHEAVHRRALFDATLRDSLQEDIAATEAHLLAQDEADADEAAREWQRRQAGRIRSVGFRYSGDGYGRFWRARNRADRIE